MREEYQTNKMIDGQRFSRWFYGFAAGHGDIGVLPVELLSFSGEAAATTNDLYWVTATENNSHRFDVQRLDADGFATIGSVEAAGESMEEVDYNFSDAAPPAGIAYYRLRAIDLDGSEKTSDVISIARQIAGPTLYPDPATDELNIAFGDRGGATLLRIMDATGRIMMQQAIDPEVASARLVTAQLAPGIWFVQLIDGSGRIIQQAPFVKR